MATGDSLTIQTQTGASGKAIELVSTQYNTATTPVPVDVQVMALGDDQGSPGSPRVAQVFGTTPTGSELGIVTRPILSSTTAASFTVAVLTTSTVVKAANTARVGINVANLATATATAYVAAGYTPTTSLYDAALAPGAYYEVPFGFKGAINAIAAATGATLVGSEKT